MAAAPVTRERRRFVMRLIRRSGVLTAPIDADTRLVYVVGALVCDDRGHLTDDDVQRGMRDPRIVALARSMLALSTPQVGPDQ